MAANNFTPVTDDVKQSLTIIITRSFLSLLEKNYQSYGAPSIILSGVIKQDENSATLQY